MEFRDFMINEYERKLAKAYADILRDVPQSPEHHPEGSVLNHVRLVRKAIFAAMEELKSLKSDAILGDVLANLDFNMTSEEIKILNTAAWLHDIADHKYDKDGTLEQRLDTFGNKHISNYADIKKVIKYVSYSSENKAILAGTPIDYDSLLTPYYALVRHIVSDADKLEALGKIGITRALTYTRDANPTFTEAQVIADVRKHADEKLLRLATEFIRTPTASHMAQKAHHEMITELNKL